jgi:hypothetical protein
MPSSPFATHIATEHLCYENAVRRSSLASDYDVDKRLITCRTSMASPWCSPTRGAVGGGEHGGHVASTMRRELRTYRLSRSLKIHECAELLSLANCIVTRKGFGSRTVK